MIPHVRKSKAILDSGFRKQNFPGFWRITKAKISQISESGLPYMEWDMSTDRYIQSFKQEKYRLMKNFALLDTFDINI